jgi:hypothetical protein
MAAESWRLCFTCAHYIEVHEQPGGGCRAPECNCGQFVWNDGVACSCGHRIGVHVAKAGVPTNLWDEPGVRRWSCPSVCIAGMYVSEILRMKKTGASRPQCGRGARRAARAVFVEPAGRGHLRRGDGAWLQATDL